MALPLLAAELERAWPVRVVADRAYNTHAIRHWLAEREIESVIPKRRGELGLDDYDRAVYRERNVIERTVNRGALWVEALPGGGDALRQAGRELPGLAAPARLRCSGGRTVASAR